VWQQVVDVQEGEEQEKVEVWAESLCGGGIVALVVSHGVDMHD